MAPRKRQQEEGWSLTTSEYRIGVGVLFMSLIGILTWLGNGVISGQTEIRDELAQGSSVLTMLQGDISAIRAEMARLDATGKADNNRLEGLIRDQEQRLTRTNDRQTDQADRLTRLETLLGTLKK